MPGRLQGKAILVAGATGDLGGAVARTYAAEGAHVVLSARGDERLKRVADEIEAAGGHRPEWVTADLSRPDEAAELARRAWDVHGRLDGIYCGSIPHGEEGVRTGDLLAAPLEHWHGMYDLIVWGPLRLY